MPRLVGLRQGLAKSYTRSDTMERSTRLGELLLAKGAVSTDGLRSALEACRRQGGRLGTWLTRLGLVNEGALLEALAQQTGCPAAPALELATAPAELRGLLHPAFAKRNMVVPFARQGRTLSVAMLHPNDLVIIDEVAAVTGLAVRAYVATEAALCAALAIPLTQTGDEGSAPPPGPPAAAVREWRQFWRLESGTPELFRALDAPVRPPLESTASTFPTLAPLAPDAQSADRAASNSLVESLAAAKQRDHVAAIVVHALRPLAARVALFSLHQGKVMGWAVHGGQSIDEDFHNLMLPLDRPSVFLNLTRGVELHIGPLGGGDGNRLLVEALGAPAPLDAIIAPVPVRGKPVAFIWLDNGEQSVTTAAVDVVRHVARAAGLALEILVLQQKIRASGRLTEGVIAD
jgi:hypothetical protein